MNTLYFGDNLEVLRDNLADDSIDLIYLDPPFNSKATYNVLFKSPAGRGSGAQIEAFEDTWHWGYESESAFDQVMQSGRVEAAGLIKAMRSFLGDNDMMAYLCMMAVRLLEFHRVLKSTGTIYLHCDTKASHFLKLLMDAVFGAKRFRNEIAWCYRGGGVPRQDFARKHDIILRYSKGEKYTFNVDAVRIPYSEDVQKSQVSRYDKSYRTSKVYEGYRPNPKGKHPEDWWLIQPLMPSDKKERLSYPTQKPVALLERIILASSNEGDIVLDPFCGCGTAIHVAEKHHRRWVGIDITHLAIGLIENRLKKAFPGIKFIVDGTPKDLDGAYDLARRSKQQFQNWATHVIGASPGRGGGDEGIDGIIFFRSGPKQYRCAIVQVKGGENVNPGMVRDLKGVLTDESPVGIFITLAEPTQGMTGAAAAAGFYSNEYGQCPKIQILTIQEIFDGKRPIIPLAEPSPAERGPAIEKRQQNLSLK